MVGEEENVVVSECSVCFEAFDHPHARRPKLLPCGHTFCTACLEQIERDDSVRCPKRCGDFTLPAGGVMGLPSNFALLKVLCDVRDKSEKPDMSLILSKKTAKFLCILIAAVLIALLCFGIWCAIGEPRLKHLGCFPIDELVIEDEADMGGENGIDTCRSSCTGHEFFAVAEEMCFCMDETPPQKHMLDISECFFPCSAEPNSICGTQEHSLVFKNRVPDLSDAIKSITLDTVIMAGTKPQNGLYICMIVFMVLATFSSFWFGFVEHLKDYEDRRQAQQQAQQQQQQQPRPTIEDMFNEMKQDRKDMLNEMKQDRKDMLNEMKQDRKERKKERKENQKQFKMMFREMTEENRRSMDRFCKVLEVLANSTGHDRQDGALMTKPNRADRMELPVANSPGSCYQALLGDGGGSPSQESSEHGGVSPSKGISGDGGASQPGTSQDEKVGHKAALNSESRQKRSPPGASGQGCAPFGGTVPDDTDATNATDSPSSESENSTPQNERAGQNKPEQESLPKTQSRHRRSSSAASSGQVTAPSGGSSGESVPPDGGATDATDATNSKKEK